MGQSRGDRPVEEKEPQGVLGAVLGMLASYHGYQAGPGSEHCWM
jgi:hypothetical protein